jgi:hypothetical protein
LNRGPQEREATVGFFKKVFNADGADKRPAGQAEAGEGDNSLGQAVDMSKLIELIRYFPLGEKLRYYPEFQKDAALDTLILGYGINDQFVFSPLGIKHQQEGDHVSLHLLLDGVEQAVERVSGFSLLIPFNRDDDNKRDYQRRAELGPRGPFRRHNTITLQACSRGGIISSLDTVVRKILPLKDGIYAGHDVVILDALPDSMSLSDQRQHYRLKTDLPATLSLRDGDTYSCTLLDFSEESVQLRFAESNEELAGLSEWRRLTLQLDVGNGGQSKLFTLDGTMYRKTGDCMVMKLQGIYKDGNLVNLGLVDILDIKASLLQHPATQRRLQEA